MLDEIALDNIIDVQTILKKGIFEDCDTPTHTKKISRSGSSPLASARSDTRRSGDQEDEQNFPVIVQILTDPESMSGGRK